MDWKRIIRDVVLIMLLTAVGGFLVAMLAATSGTKVSMPAIAVSNIGLAALGFAVSGSLTRTHRVRHLLTVAALVWVASLVNVPLGVPVAQWALGSIAILFACAIGGAVAALIFRPKRDSTPPLQ